MLFRVGDPMPTLQLGSVQNGIRAGDELRCFLLDPVNLFADGTEGTLAPIMVPIAITLTTNNTGENPEPQLGLQFATARRQSSAIRYDKFNRITISIIQNKRFARNV